MDNTDDILSNSIIDIRALRKTIISHKSKSSPDIFRILLETVCCKKHHIKKDIEIKKILYDKLFEYSFIEYIKNNNNGISKHSLQKLIDKSEKDAEDTREDKFLIRKMEFNPKIGISYDKTGTRDQLKLELQNNFFYRYKVYINRKILHQIHIDIKRLNINHKVIDDNDCSFIYYNILVLISHRRPTLGYIQGMADILVPFVVEFCKENVETAESSAYYCYVKLLDNIQSNIVNLQIGLIFRLNSVIEKIDPILFAFLKHSHLEIHMFSFRWFNCLYIREFDYDNYLKILASMLCYDNINDFLIYFGASLLMFLKDELLTNGFNENILILQNLASRNWKSLEIDFLISTTDVYYNTLGSITI